MSFIDFIAGWIGGIAGLIVGHPADTIKTQQQALGENLFRTIIRIYRYDGLTGYYKGFLAPFVSVGPINALFFTTYGSCLKMLQPSNSSSNRIDFDNPLWIQEWLLLACFVGGFVQMLASCPVELIKTLLQSKQCDKSHLGKCIYISPYNTSYEAIRGIFNSQGMLGFYRGGTPMFYRDVPTSALYMLVYEVLLPHSGKQSRSQEIIAGGLAGVASWCFIIPFDVVKTHMQSDNPEKYKYRGMLDCTRKLYNKYGGDIFWKGFTTTTVRAFPVNAAIFLGYESTLTLYKKFMSKKS